MRFVAYLDAASGSIFLQAVIGIVLGGLVIFRSILGKIVARIRAVFTKSDTSTSEDS